MVDKEERQEFEEVEELEDLRRYIEDFTSFLPLAFCMVNPIDFILDANQTFEDLTGYEKMEAIGNNVEFLFKNKPKIERFKARVANKKSAVEEEVSLITKGGVEVPVRISALARRDSEGVFSGYFLTFIDITESKGFEEELERKIKERTEELEKAKKRLEESEKVLEIKIKARTRELRDLNENLEEEVRRRTKELEERAKDMEKSQSALINILEDSEEALKEAEREREKTLTVITNFMDGLFLFDEEKKLILVNPKAEDMFNIKEGDVVGKEMQELRSISELRSLINFIGEGTENIFREEIELKNGIFVEITTSLIEHEDEKFAMLVNVHDVTREKRIERIKSEFVSVAAHQLRTPLSGIKWALKTILEEGEGKISEDQADLVQRAYDANNRMVNLVNDLLNVTRIEEGRYIYEPKRMDLLEIITPVIESYKEKIKEKGLDFEGKGLKEALPPVVVDKEKIGVVVQNLLDNAMKYTEKGKITIAVEQTDKRIKVSITDTGVGIPEDQQERLFAKFFRSANVMRMETEGSGLGLFISKNIVEAHGGKIDFTSKIGEGSTFYFTIPAGEEEIEKFFKTF